MSGRIEPFSFFKEQGFNPHSILWCDRVDFMFKMVKKIIAGLNTLNETR